MIDKNLKLSHLYSIGTDLIFEGYWKGKWFQAVFVSGEHDYGWRQMTFLPEFTANDEGVFNDENEEFDGIEEALSDVDVSVHQLVDIK
jgi:hypothetical protein